MRRSIKFGVLPAMVLWLGISHATITPIPLIVKTSPSANLNSITSYFGATIVDSIPGADTYLLNATSVGSLLPVPLLSGSN